MEILEGIMYHGVIDGVECQLDGHHCAYRRARGAEMVLIDVMDYARRYLSSPRFVYLVSFDVAGAFDGVLRHRLMKAMTDFRACPYFRRVVHGLARGRTFQVKLRARCAEYTSGIHFMAHVV